ncbi:uncharacterized protein FTOL_07235 [Fusarium torulosum]|uniref:Uncharacterized protein n=1 Tax=Fusarium torulosum TaxID=33205 RepID=A0AAE8MAG3_9HYPO|nr:uncharacterized protein FTOL_07235 [Fusarium torulosum]
MSNTHSKDPANGTPSMLLSFIHDDMSVAERLASTPVVSRDTEARTQRLAAELQRLGSIM